MAKEYKINQQALLEELKYIFKEFARIQKRPLCINTILMTINFMPEFVGPKVPYEPLDLDSDFIMDELEKVIRYRTRLPPCKSGIYKTFIAAFAASLDETLVDNGEISDTYQDPSESDMIPPFFP